MSNKIAPKFKLKAGELHQAALTPHCFKVVDKWNNNGQIIASLNCTHATKFSTHIVRTHTSPNPECGGIRDARADIVCFIILDEVGYTVGQTGNGLSLNMFGPAFRIKPEHPAEVSGVVRNIGKRLL